MLNLICAIALLLADPATAPATQSTLPQLVAIDERAAAIQSISADFVQEKHSPLLSDPLVTRGNVKAMGANVLWTATQPEPSQTHVGPKLLSIYFPKQKLVEEYNLTPATASLTASPLPRLAVLQETFELFADQGEGLPMPPGTTAVRLTPRDPELGNYVEQVRVVLDVDRGVVLAFEMTDPDGEVTLTRFERIQVNPSLAASDLMLHLPADVKRVSPGGPAK